jgi:2-polyprenyl-3-methyl-5-hydroxy-6-metoxy-1,4-benzoquinol methylase
VNFEAAKTNLRLIGEHTEDFFAALFTDNKPNPPAGPFGVFHTEAARAINRARQQHLGSLGLDLSNKRVLEVGAGVGLHTPFFLERGCEVVVSDGNLENVGEIRRRLPQLRVEHIDMESDGDLSYLGEFDLIYCYGLLYHLANPERAIARLAKVSKGQLLLETCVALSELEDINYLRDFVSNNQAVSGIGCRPSRKWILERLKKHFGYGYITDSQPDHGDFPTDWNFPMTNLIYRAVFVGSKAPLTNSHLLSEPLQSQSRHVSSAP